MSDDNGNGNDASRTGSRVSIRVLCHVAMFIALAFVLERLTPIIDLPTMRITLSFIPIMFCGMLYGPLWGATAYGLADILGWPLMALTPIPLILASRILNGFIYGLILRRENLKIWPHSVINAFLVQIICGMGLTTIGLALFWGVPYLPMLWTRLPQHAILIVLQIVVFPVLIKLRDALRKSGYVSG